MNILDSLRDILEEIMPYVDPEMINYDTRLYDDLGMSELAVASFAMAVEARFGFSFPKDSGIQSVGEVAQYIEKYENYDIFKDDKDSPELP